MIRKILLVIEDYHERTYLQTMLKKIGWDVIGLSTELGLSGQVLTFRPDAILLSQMIRRTRGLDISKAIKRHEGFPKVVLLGSGTLNKEILQLNKVDLFLVSPINNRLLFEFLEKAGGFSAKASLQKIRSMRYPLEKLNDEQLKVLKSHGEQAEALAPMIDKVVFDEVTARKKKYDDFLTANPPKSVRTHFDTSEIQAAINKIAAEPYTDEDKALDAEKKDFLKALFDASKKGS